MRSAGWLRPQVSRRTIARRSARMRPLWCAPSGQAAPPRSCRDSSPSTGSHPARRGAHVPRRGAAPGARYRDHRRADRGQDRSVQLGSAPRPVELAAGQRLHLGAAAHRQGAGRRGRGPRRGVARCGEAPGRAGDFARRWPRPCASSATNSCSGATWARPWPALPSWRRKATASPTTCWARRPAPRRTPAATISPIPIPSPRSPPSARVPASATGRESRSSCRRCTRATSSRSVTG